MYESTTNIVIIVFLLVANAFFVAAEFALVKAKGLRIEGLARGGNAKARLTMRIQGNLEPYLAACQLGITMASLGLGWVGEPAVAALLEPLFHKFNMPQELIHTTAFLIGFIIFSSLHIVVGEQVPKTLAIRQPEPVSLWVAYPLQAFYLLAFPLNWLLNRATAAILKIFKVSEATHGEVYSGEEIESLIDVSKEHGELEGGKADMLKNMFAFDQRTVKEIMVARSEIDMLDLEDVPEQWQRIMQERQHSRYPVVRGGTKNIVGILLVKDLYNAILAGKNPWPSLEHYVRDVHIVPSMLKIGSLFDSMRVAQSHMAVVVNEYGDFTGLITMEDLLEEIVGEIADELDDAVSQFPIEQVDATTWHVHGLAPLADVKRATSFQPRGNVLANTLSGLFMERLERLPEEGTELVENGYRLTVTAMNQQRVELVRMQRLPGEPGDHSDTSSSADVVED